MDWTSDLSGGEAMFAGAVLAAFLAIWGLVVWKASTQHAASTFSSFLTGVAILVAGYWYFIERRGTPHADLAQVLEIHRTGDQVAIESTVTIHNLGSTLLRIHQIDVRLQQIDPVPAWFAIDQVPLTGAEWPGTFSNGRSAMFSGAELQWPTLRYWHDEGLVEEIEPGETDALTTTFLLPCTINSVRVQAEVRKGPEDFWWKTRSFGSLDEACGRGKRKG